MPDKLHVDILTVEGRRFNGDADFVVAPGSEGELGVLPHHVPLLTGLAPGAVKVRNDGDEQFFFVSGGFLEVRPDQVTVLADAAERAEDIDEAVEAAKGEAPKEERKPEQPKQEQAKQEQPKAEQKERQEGSRK